MLFLIAGEMHTLVVPVNRMGTQPCTACTCRTSSARTCRVAAPALSSAPNVAAQVKELAELGKKIGHQRRRVRDGKRKRAGGVILERRTRPGSSVRAASENIAEWR